MTEDQKRIEDILVKGLSDILRRTIKVNQKDQLAIAAQGQDVLASRQNRRAG